MKNLLILLILSVGLCYGQTINGTPVKIKNIPESSVTGLTSDLAGKQPILGFTPENSANKGQANGYPSLDNTGKVPSGQLPSTSSTASTTSFTQTGTGATATNLGARANDLVNARTDFGADNTGSTDASTALNSALSAVIASGKNSLYIPAGTYSITKASGILFNMTSGATGLCVYGDGPGLTILKFANSVTLTADVTVVQLNGTNQCLHDLSILNGSGMSGAHNWTAVGVNQGSFNPHIYNLEITGIYGSGTAGGGGITTFQPFGQTMVNTTVGSSISSGSQTVTPGNMNFIYVGQRLLIGGTSEAVTVTSKTATTFTATFANSHISSDPITSNSQGYQGAIIEGNYIHDSYLATAIVLNSSSNVVKANRIINVGSNSTQHGIYDQGGSNRVLQNYIEGISGAGIHGHKFVPQEDGSGAVYDGNVIYNYGNYCILTDTLISDGVNPEVPSMSQYLTRYAMITNNECRERIGMAPSGVIAAIQTGNPAMITSNILEDACGNSGSCLWISAQSGNVPNSVCVVSHNILNVLNETTTTQYAIGLTSPYCISDHNTVMGWISGHGIYLNATQTASQGDMVNASQTNTSANCVALNANNVRASLHK